MSSSSATASGSRSPSPATPESSDSPSHPIAIQNDFELTSWYNSLHTDDTVPNATAWHHNVSPYALVGKTEEQPMLQFDDLIEEHAYDDSSSPFLGIDSSPLCTVSAGSKMSSNVHAPALQTPTQSMHASDTLIPPSAPVSHTKPIPPPAARPRKRDSFAAFQKVVFPPKESCYNLPIMVPSIPEGGTKSRVETQVRVTVDLAHAHSPSGQPFKYDRVGSWKWLKLPSGTATKRRTRKEGKIDPTPQEMLHLTASVSCASPPHNPVLSCGSCQAREAKRVARKLAARVRPARSDSDSPEDANASSKAKQEDTTSIVQFNCPDILDFSTGSVVLPLRITCYCRHHREKVGFNVHFTMMDHNGRIVGAGTSRPIMITDDHKTVNANKQGAGLSNGLHESDIDWSQMGRASEPTDSKAPSKRKLTKEPGQAKKRIKPYDAASRGASTRVSREASVVSLLSSSVPATRPATPLHYYGSGALTQRQDPVSCALPMVGTETSSISPSDTMHCQSNQLPTFDMHDITSPIGHPLEVASPTVELLSSPLIPSNACYSPNGAPLITSAPLVSGVLRPMPYIFFDPSSPPPISSLPLPKIHRLIPATGPTHGGIEVTVLGANFHPAMTLSCVFGDAVASSTQRWSDNTLVCVLPPRPSPGVVAVWFDGIHKDNDDSSSCLFTYTDETDRALMELALQVVGLKMTGKIEDAKNVAMRIVGTSGGDESQGGGDSSNMMQLALSSYRDIRPLLLTRIGGEDFESVIVEFLSVLDVPVDQSATTMSSAISHTTPSGQTLLHLAAMLGFPALVQFLITHEIDLDARDRNGYTALHFAVVSNSRECARLLVTAGADLEIVNVLGKTPQEQAPSGLFDNVFDGSDEDEDSVDSEEDEESRWGDAEEDDDELVVSLRRSSRRTTRRRDDTPLTNTPEQKHQELPPADAPPYSQNDKPLIGPDTVDEKQAASFVAMIHRKFAQLHAPQGIIPNMPQFPLPHLPEMPWGALQQIPVAFPIFVPMPGWASFLGEKRDGEQEPAPGPGDILESRVPTGSSAIRAAQEWRATWEKWMALAMATATMRQEEAPPPMYTPRADPTEARGQPAHSPRSEPEDDGESSSTTARPHTAVERPVTRRFGYPSVPITDQDVNSYAYRPAKVQLKRLRTKNDRMLVYFWIPILLLSLLWALYTGVRHAYTALKMALPLRTALQG